MFSNLLKNQQVFIIDKREDGVLKIGVVDEVKNQNPYNVGLTSTMPFDIVVKYEDGNTESFPQLPPTQSVFTYNNGDVIVCDSRESAQMEIDKINAFCVRHIELMPHYEALRDSTEQMKRKLNPSYAKQQQTDEDIKYLKEGYSQMSGTLVEMKGMMERMIAGISSSKKSNN